MTPKPSKNELPTPARGIGIERRATISRLLAKGYTAHEIALHVAKKKGRNYTRIKGQVQRVAAEDQEFRTGQALAMEGGMIMDLPAIGEAVVRRAKRGRVDAAKLVLEITGVHNPKVKHEHSGDITISMNAIPRPEKTDDRTSQQVLDDGDVVDATVVEDD